MGRPHDYQYDMDDGKIYCSEVLHKAMLDATGIRLGRLQKRGPLKWQPYKQTIEADEEGPVPLQREIITPRGLSEAAQLDKIHSGHRPQ